MWFFFIYTFMKYIKPYESHNESWRKTKAYLRVPALVVDIALSKLLNYVPKLNFLYKSMAAKIDSGTSFNSGPGTQLNDTIEEIKLDDIKDEKIRKSLKLSGLFSDWHIYKIDRLSHDGKTPIYISKDILHQGDSIHGERLSDDTATEFYVVAAKHTEEHEEMSRERRSSYEKKEYNKCKSMLDKAKDKGYFFGRTSMGDFTPLFHTLVKKNYLDLVKKCLDNNTYRPGVSVRDLIVRRFNSDGDRSGYNGSKSALDLSSAFPEMRKLLLDSLHQEWQKNKN